MGKIFLSNKRILFFAPHFFEYDKIINNKMVELGAVVDWYDERPSNSNLFRALLKICPWIFGVKSNKYYKKIIMSKKEKYDFIFVIKGEMITKKTIKLMKKQYPEAKLILYLWDSIKNIKGIICRIELYDRVFSFDLSDCTLHKNINFLPLFYSDEYAKQDVNYKQRFDCAFIGTVHSDRYRIIRKFMDECNKNNIKFFCYLYMQSKAKFWIYKFIKKEFRHTKISDFSYKKMNSKEIIKIFNESKTIFDIQEPNQSGLTIRTIEALGMKKKIITTNEDIINYDLYNPNDVCIINRKIPKIDYEFIKGDYIDIDNKVYEKYSIKNWLKEILEFEETKDEK